MISFIGRQNVEMRMDYGQAQRRLRDTELQDENGNLMSFYLETATVNYPTPRAGNWLRHYLLTTKFFT